VEATLGAEPFGIAGLSALMLGFFVAFNVLEAMLPALVSRVAPAHGRGVAIGVYNTTQTLGVFFGGLLGGWVARHHGANGVFLACAGLCALWLVVAAGMRPVPRAVNGLSNAAL
jgi:MFS family permease